jgi:hypothetical protein
MFKTISSTLFQTTKNCTLKLSMKVTTIVRSKGVFSASKVNFLTCRSSTRQRRVFAGRRLHVLVIVDIPYHLKKGMVCRFKNGKVSPPIL